MIKHRFFISALLLLLYVAAYSQGNPSLGPSPNPPKLETSFGVKAGLNLSNISNGQSEINLSPGIKADFHAGIFVNFHFGYRNEGSPVGTGYFGLQPEILYSRQGFVADNTTINFDYITVPIMAKIYVAKSFNLEVGPFISYLIAVSPNSAVIGDSQITLSDLKGGMDVGAAIGAGYEFVKGPTIGARFNYGMSDMAGNLAWKNYVIAVSLGWKF